MAGGGGGEQPREDSHEGVRASPGHSQPGLRDAALALSGAADSAQRPQGGVAGREGPRVHSDGEHSEASLESDRLLAGVLGRLRDHRPPNTSDDHTAGCRPLVGCEINLVVHSQHFKTD